MNPSHCRAARSVFVGIVAGVSVALLTATSNPTFSAQDIVTRPKLQHAESSECGWVRTFWVGDLDGEVAAMVVWDDGSGPALFLGGEFVAAGGVAANNIVKWDGEDWIALTGPSGTGTTGNLLSGRVESLVVFDDGTGEALYAGGWFTEAGGVTVNGVAKWNGTGWSALTGSSGTGVSGVVYAMEVYDDGSGEALFVAGDFLTAGGLTTNRVARWNGTDWSALTGPSGTGVNGTIFALQAHNDGSGEALYAGGMFNFAGGLGVHYLASWAGGQWWNLPGLDPDGWVTSLEEFDDGSGEALYVGGWLTEVGGVLVNGIAEFRGGQWFALSGPSGTGVIDPSVMALAVYDDGGGQALYAGGAFNAAGGVTVNGIAKWDGSAWSALSGSSGIGVADSVFAFAAYDDGGGELLYVGGSFIEAGGVAAHYAAAWDGSEWSPLSDPTGTATNYWVNALETYNDGTGEALYAGGGFTIAGGVTVNRVGKWKDAAWTALTGPSATGVTGPVFALKAHNDGGSEALFAGGSFSTAGGVTAYGVARWDGVSWSALTGPAGNGTNGEVTALVVYDDGGGPALYAGGWFTTAGGVTVNHIAKWDGTVWSPLTGASGTGTENEVHSLAVYDDGTGAALFVGGNFLTAGGVTVNSVAKWNGTDWFSLTGPTGTGVEGEVFALQVYDDGSGAALYAGGSLVFAGGVGVNRIAKWDGTSWAALSGPSGTGTDQSVNALAVYDEGNGLELYAGGRFINAGGVTVNHIARWDGAAWEPLFGPSGTGADDDIHVLLETGNGLFAGGKFTSAGGLAGLRMAKWRCSIFCDGFESGDTSEWSATVP